MAADDAFKDPLAAPAGAPASTGGKVKPRVKIAGPAEPVVPSVAASMQAKPADAPISADAPVAAVAGPVAEVSAPDVAEVAPPAAKPAPVVAEPAPAAPIAAAKPAKAVKTPRSVKPGKAPKPIAAKPVAAKPVVAKPVVAKPVVAKPLPAKVSAPRVSVAKVPAAKSIPAKPVVAKPALQPVKVVVKPVPATVALAATPSAAPKTAPKTDKTFAGLFNPFTLEETTMNMGTNFAGFQEAITEAQAKAKAAFDKSSTALGEVGDFAKGNVEAMIESGKIFAEGVQGMGTELVAEGRSAFETMTADIKELAAVKSPTDFFKIQGDLLRKNFDSAVAYGSKNSEAMLKLFSDAAAPISGRVSLAVEKVRTTSL